MMTPIKTVLFLSACLVLFGCSTNEQANLPEKTNVTRIHLSAEEAKRFVEASGGEEKPNETIAGVEIVLHGTPADPEIKKILDTYKSESVEVTRSGS